jgi:CheY-like chemotaxis protein
MGWNWCAPWRRGPDVQLALVDLNMPVMNGFETLAWMKQHAPSIRPLALTFEGSEEAVVKGRTQRCARLPAQGHRTPRCCGSRWIA